MVGSVVRVVLLEEKAVGVDMTCWRALALQSGEKQEGLVRVRIA